jgi:hypothetical protein
VRFQSVWEQRICYALPNFVKRRFAFVITERDPLDTNPEVAAEFLMECAKGRFATINSCFGEDASQFTGRLTLIRTYMEAETRDSRRKLAEVDEGILANGEVWTDRIRVIWRRVEGELLCAAENSCLSIPMIVTITFRRCLACRCSNRKIPCHVPSCRLDSQREYRFHRREHFLCP